MALILIEGARKAGKTHLLSLLGTKSALYKSFKFDFTESYSGLKLPANERETHMFGLSKEIMLHQLNRDGIIGASPIIIDRGILTCAVWGVLEKRISIEDVESQLLWMIENDLFKNVIVINVLGNSTIERKKDVWDHMDSKGEEERKLFSHFFSFLVLRGVSAVPFNNTFDSESEEKFKNLIDSFFNICAGY